jgi:hypothetical protein
MAGNDARVDAGQIPDCREKVPWRFSAARVQDDRIEHRLDLLHRAVGIGAVADHHRAVHLGDEDRIGAMHDIHRVGLHHPARDRGRAEQEDVGIVEDHLVRPDIAAGAVEHFAHMGHEVDHKPTVEDRAFDGEGRVVETALPIEGDDILSLRRASEGQGRANGKRGEVQPHGSGPFRV